MKEKIKLKPNAGIKYDPNKIISDRRCVNFRERFFVSNSPPTLHCVKPQKLALFQAGTQRENLSMRKTLKHGGRSCHSFLAGQHYEKEITRLWQYKPRNSSLFKMLQFFKKRSMRDRQDDRQWNVLSGRVTILAGHCPLTGHYFEPCEIIILNPKLLVVNVKLFPTNTPNRLLHLLPQSSAV